MSDGHRCRRVADSVRSIAASLGEFAWRAMGTAASFGRVCLAEFYSAAFSMR
jgi:hypothetical protein